MIERLSLAHARIEASFIEGGATLVAVMEMITGLIDTLDRFTRMLDGETTAATITGLQRTVADLANLPDLAASRQAAFDEISQRCADAFRHVEEMRETFRYLKVFATTVKITGASIAEFADFADEIRERIHSGAEEINYFAAKLDRMRGELAAARNFSAGIRDEFRVTIPEIVANLDENARRLKAQHERMAALAAEVKTVAQAVQGKIATTLSALQIGDITRQRIEHVLSSFLHLDAFLSSADGQGLVTVEVSGVEATIFHLAHAQLDVTLADFRQKCASIFATIASFSADASRILALRDDIAGYRGDPDASILKAMEYDIGHACDLVSRVEGRSQDSTALVGSVTGAVQSLIASIETIRSIKTDIHYMALNSNLRCSRLGDEGRSVNVVSGELRTFAGRLETPADEVVDDMRRVERAAETLGSGPRSDLSNFGTPLAEARGAVASVLEEMNSSLAALGAEGDAVFGRIAAAVRTLDFENNLGEVLDGCVAIAAELAGASEPPAPIPAAESLRQRIYADYTMAQERDIHRGIFPSAVLDAMPQPTVGASQSDEDLFEDALF
nr:chemotaxis protein [Sinorhizobium terangae]